MRPFIFDRAGDMASALQMGRATGRGERDAPVQYLAGGTTLIDLMKLDVLTPQRVVDISPLRATRDEITVGPQGLVLGAFASMAAVARHVGVVENYPAIAESLEQAASAQLRNMATLGGNVLQRTRCEYFRDTSWGACNKRDPGSGCTALKAVNRNHAVLGVSDACISQYPGDFGIALIALGADVTATSEKGERTFPFAKLHKAVDNTPHLETTLLPGEIITRFTIPAAAWTKRSAYVKVRDRASYEFAIASAAVAVELDGPNVRTCRIGLGGMAYTPWRAENAEQFLVGKPLTETTADAAAKLALQGAITHGDNDFKPELARRTLVRALLQVKAMDL